MKVIFKIAEEQRKSEKGMKQLFNYICRDKAVYKTCGVGVPDEKKLAVDLFMINKKRFKKDIDEKFRFLEHSMITFEAGTDKDLIYKICEEFCEEAYLEKGFNSFFVIHEDKDNPHAHILTDNVNFITGNMLISLTEKQYKSSDKKRQEKIEVVVYEQRRELIQDICIRNGYEIDEKEKYPFLIELGIQNKEGKIIKSKFNKFKQINKYLEFIKQATTQLNTNKQITILDFGSGKSYLTFSAYYYLSEVLKLNVKIIGIDLKKEVIEHCNNISKKLNFNNLSFIYGDVIDYENKDEIDMVISLHACNTATDIAILKALGWNAKVFFAVPCCQKEINSQLGNEFLPFMLKHGIIKEKFSTLLTDSIRSEVLEAFGYKSDIVEFISEENTPKNQLIRAYKTSTKLDKEKIKQIEKFTSSLNIKMFLLDEVAKLI